MRTKLPLLMLALLPFAGFSQSAKSKVSVHPLSAKHSTAAALKTPTSASPAAYCMPALDCTDNDMITNVTFAGINNETTCSPAGYGDFTAITTTDPVLAGSSYPISVTVGTGWPYENVSVWIDYDMNDVFDASEFTYVGNLIDVASGLTLNGTIAIPAGTPNGNYAMRVRVAAVGPDAADNTLACDEDQGFGESEDYTVVVGVAAPPTGCLTSPNGAYPSAAFTPACNGTAQSITAAGWAGEYSSVNVTTGTAYTFGVSNPAYFITIGDSTGTTVLASGTGSVTWTANMTGAVRFYVHTDVNCGSGTSATVHSRTVLCGTVPPPPVEPDYGCDQNYTGEPDLANNITKSLNYSVANDFFVPMESDQYVMNTITATMVPLAGGADMSSFDIKILSDSGTNTPGAVIHTIAGVVPTTVTTLPDTFAGYATYAVTLDMGGYSLPVNAAADTRYWVSLQATSASSPASSIYWIGYQYVEGWVTASNYQSTDNGATYTQIIYASAPGQHYDSIWSIDAECDLAAVNEAGSREVSYYPNPVRDYLTINSKKAIETVHVYNVAGQKMPVSSKIVNGKLDMSKLTPGVYIISTILEGGKNESFKVIKK